MNSGDLVIAIKQQRARLYRFEGAAKVANEALQREADALKELEAQCSHDWETKYTPIHHDSYAISGDPWNTIGVDRRGETFVPARTEAQWTRTCKVCGKTETTLRAMIDQKEKRIPQF